MAKVVDITDKLNFDQKPKLLIKGKELQVNSDAMTILKVLQKIGDEPTVPDLLDACELIFDEKNQKRLNDFNLNITDYMAVVKAALDLAMGNGTQVGE